MGDNFSIGWRVFDAQYWGVPQRRRRIYLVADFNGRSAEEILFKSERMSRDTRESEEKRTSITNTVEDGIRNASHVVCEHHGQDFRIRELPKVCCTLNNNGDKPLVLYENHGRGNNQPLVVDNVRLYDVRITSSGTKNSRDNVYETTTSRTISCNGGSPEGNYGGVAVVYSTSKASFHTKAHSDRVDTLVASDYKDAPIISGGRFVRRITPKECSRLQGFPDGWCDNLGTENPTAEELIFWDEVFETHRKVVGKSTKRKTENQLRKWLRDPHSDSAEYKMWGNGVALPNVHYILNGIANELNKGSSNGRDTD